VTNGHLHIFTGFVSFVSLGNEKNCGSSETDRNSLIVWCMEGGNCFPIIPADGVQSVSYRMVTSSRLAASCLRRDGAHQLQWRYFCDGINAFWWNFLFSNFMALLQSFLFLKFWFWVYCRHCKQLLPSVSPECSECTADIVNSYCHLLVQNVLSVLPTL
jgi:hypothetical protein